MGELRKDPILGRWVIIATERSKRPNAYLKDAPTQESSDPKTCPFCYGNEKLTPPEIFAARPNNSKPNTKGWDTRVVPNKFPALGIDHPLRKKGYGLFDMMTNFGAHEVIIETPDHKREVYEQSTEEITKWISTIQERVEDLHKDIRFRYLLVFKNKGKEAGASLTHPHHQIIATPVTPKRVREEMQGAEAYYKLKERCIFCDLIDQEIASGERVVYENDAFVSICPYASRFPFEIWILPKHHCIDFYDDIVKNDIKLLAAALKNTVGKLNKALKGHDYNYLVHASPNRFDRRGYWKTIHDDYHWHIELFPRLTITAGFEWGTGFYINPTSPEDAARILRETKFE